MELDSDCALEGGPDFSVWLACHVCPWDMNVTGWSLDTVILEAEAHHWRAH